jgi:hypothetical protein
MARPASGSVVERPGKNGVTFAIRFRAYGKRRYLTLDVATPREAEVELANVLADVRRGIWRPSAEPVAIVEESKPETFHEFARYAAREAEQLAPRTLEDFRWALSTHLLPFFKDHLLDQITIAEVDRYKVAKAMDRARIDTERERARKKGERCLERGLSNRSINHVIGVLAAVLETAVEYELVASNAAAGRRRRLKAERPRRLWVEPEQLMSLLDAAETPRKLLGAAAARFSRRSPTPGYGSTRRSRYSANTSTRRRAR